MRIRPQVGGQSAASGRVSRCAGSSGGSSSLSRLALPAPRQRRAEELSFGGDMLFQVEMTVLLPPDMPEDRAADIKAREKAYSQDLQRQCIWRHIWRVTGSY